MRRPNTPWIWRYGIAVVSVAVATGGRILLDPVLNDRLPYETLFIAIMFTAWSAGAGPSLLAVGLSVLSAGVFILEPRGSFSIRQPEHRVGLVVFGFVGFFSALIAEAMHADRRRAERAREAEEAQRARWRVTLESIGDAVIVTDETGRVTFLNPVAESLTGWAAPEAAGAPLDQVFRIVEEGSRRPSESPVARVLREGVVIGLANHTLLIARDGTERPIDDSAAPIRDEAGAITGAILVFRDVTERRRAEDALRESEARCRSVIDSNIVGIGFWRADGAISDANDALLAMLGCGREEIASGAVRFPDFTPPEWREVDERALAEIAATGSCAPFEKEYVTRDGVRTPVVVAGAHFAHDKTRGPFFALDISDRKRAERALRDVDATLRGFYETSPLMMGVVEVADDDILHLTDNAATGRFFGADPAALAGRWASELGVPPDHLREWVAHYRESERTGEPVRFDYPHKTREGTRWLSAIVHCIERLPGGRCRCSYVAEDATERKRVEEALGRQSERLRLLWEAATVLLTAEDPDAMLRGLFGRIAPRFGLDTYFNFLLDESGQSLRLCSCAGIPDEEVRKLDRLELGQAVCGTVALRRRPIVATHIQDSDEPMTALVKGYGIRAYACNPLMVDGRLLGTLSFASRTRDGFDPDELEFLGTISHYVTVAYERWRLVRELRDQDRRKDEFLATLAHELRNPLAPVRNALEIIKMPGVDAEAVEKSREMMERQVHHLVRLVDDLLDVSRVMRGKIELRKERVDLAAVVARALETAQPLIDAGGHELNVELPDASLPLEADPVRLSQVVGNLLANAAKYTEPGGRIALSARREGGTAVLEVRDTGIGLAPEMIPRIFDLFVQADHAPERSQGGLGVGLTLARSLVEMHGGTIEVRSAGPGQGSAFEVRLPLGAPEAAAPNGQACVDSRPGAAGRRLLVVDDNQDAADSLGMLLRLQGHEVRVAYDGASALAIAPEYRPEIALLDIGMPGMDGHELARRLREEPATGGVVLVAVTGWGAPEDRRRTAEAGFDHHLVKPVDLDALGRLLRDGRRAGAGPPRRPRPSGPIV